MDVGAFHADFINANSKKGAARVTVRHVIGDMPFMSDELESEVNQEKLLAAFRSMFPGKSGDVNNKEIH